MKLKSNGIQITGYGDYYPEKKLKQIGRAHV